MENTRLRKWFGNGLIRQALLGDGEFRIPDHTYRDSHDRILVISELFTWAKNEGKEEQVSLSFQRIIEDLLDERFTDAIDILYCYFLVKEDSNELELESLSAQIQKAIKSNTVTAMTDDRLRNQLIALGMYLPDIAQS